MHFTSKNVQSRRFQQWGRRFKYSVKNIFYYLLVNYETDRSVKHNAIADIPIAHLAYLRICNERM